MTGGDPRRQEPGLNVIVTAGGSPVPSDPLYALTRGGIKAMLPIAGKPMIQWVLDALGASDHVESVTVVGLSPMTDLTCAKPLTLLPENTHLLAGLQDAANTLRANHPEARYALILTCDIPAVTPAAIDWMATQVQADDADFYYTFIDRANMEARFPQTRRAWSQLKDRQVCSAELTGVRLDRIDSGHPFLEKLLLSHRSPLRQVSLIGYDTMFLLLVRQLTLPEAEKSINQRFKMNARALLCPFAEAGMDLTHPQHFEILNGELAARPESTR